MNHNINPYKIFEDLNYQGLNFIFFDGLKVKFDPKSSKPFYTHSYQQFKMFENAVAATSEFVAAKLESKQRFSKEHFSTIEELLVVMNDESPLNTAEENNESSKDLKDTYITLGRTIDQLEYDFPSGYLHKLFVTTFV
jgi:hypothetical protein